MNDVISLVFIFIAISLLVTIVVNFLKKILDPLKSGSEWVLKDVDNAMHVFIQRIEEGVVHFSTKGGYLFSATKEQFLSAYKKV
jgi:hypothetical protein